MIGMRFYVTRRRKMKSCFDTRLIRQRSLGDFEFETRCVCRARKVKPPRDVFPISFFFFRNDCECNLINLINNLECKITIISIILLFVNSP